MHYSVSLGVSCSVWSGCWASTYDDQVLMACAALDGYHSVVCYSWDMNGYVCRGENTPLLYASREGKYHCKIANEERNILFISSFSVQSKQQGSLKTEVTASYDIAGVDGVASVRKLGRDSLDGSFQHVVTESGTPGIYI